jgi:hypothetical protein
MRANMWVSAAAVILTALLGPAVATEIIGLDICYCHPDTVTFQLKFNMVCPDTNVEGPGIFDTACITDTRNKREVTDKVPTVVNQVQIYELDDTEAVVSQAVFEGPFSDGANITYTSIVKSAPDKITDAESLPVGFQVTIEALNQLEQTLVHTWIIKYTGECGSRCNDCLIFVMYIWQQRANIVFPACHLSQSFLSLKSVNKSVGAYLYVCCHHSLTSRCSHFALL